MRAYRNQKMRRLNIEFRAPRPGDAGYDLYALAEHCLAPGERAAVGTGLHLEIPPGYVGLVKDRSSMAIAGIHAIAGVIDSAYRGELRILLVNLGDAEYKIRPRQKIAQLLIVSVNCPAVEEVVSLRDLSATERGEGGFGSTGD